MYENKKIFILGFAKSGYEVAKVLANKNNYILINDGGSLKETDKEKYEELKNLGVNFVFNSHPDDLFDESYDLLIKNPGISIDHKYVLKANKLNIPVVNEVEVAYNLLKDKNVKIIAITGTNGKTTTTTLIYEMLKKDKFSVHLAGNIGYPLCSILDKVKENDIIVTEISCQQLENMHEFNPNVAVMTNISEAHLEFMKTFEHYKYVKSKLLKNQTNKDVAILNYSDEILKEFSKNVKSKVKWYSSKEKLNGSYILNDNIYYYDELIISLKDIKLRGIHNYENIMASIMAVKEFNCSNDSIKEVTDLKDKKAAQTLSSSWSLLAKDLGAEIVSVSAFQDSIDLITSKRADFSVNSELAYNSYIKEKPDAGIKKAITLEDVVTTAIPVKKGEERFKNKLNEAIASLQEKGTLKEISMKYFGFDITSK